MKVPCLPILIAAVAALLPGHLAALTATSFFPANNATSVCADTPLKITLDSAPAIGISGSIRIYNAGGSLVETLDLAVPHTRMIGGTTYNALPVLVTGNTASILPRSGVLAYNTTYYVTVDSTVFPGYAGISANTTWRFTTKSVAPSSSETYFTVAADGSGDFCTVQGAIDLIPAHNTTKRYINIRNGTYQEIVRVSSKHNLAFRGQNRKRVILSYSNNSNLNASTNTRPLFNVAANDVSFDNLTLHNTTPDGGSQAEALRVNAQRCIVNNCDLRSYQDTFLVNNAADSAYIKDSFIEGDADFIWGSGRVVFQSCEIKSLDGGYVCAMRNPAGQYGAVFLDCRSTAIDVSPEWTDSPVLFVIENALPEGKASLTVFCAQANQTVEIESIRVIRYGPETDVAKFPRIRRTYSGREPNAPWRKAALDRIEKIRKADCSLTLRDSSGKPLANKQVKLTLRRHEFGFGSATPASYYAADTPDAERFRDIIDRLFSIVVFENDLKDMWWGKNIPPHGRASRQKETDVAFNWLGERHIAIRGHYLMQVAIPGNLAKWDNDSVRSHFLDTSLQRIEYAGDRVIEWDAINHLIAWGGASLFSKRPGLEHLDREVLAHARTLTKLPLLVNEDQLFRPGAQSENKWNYLLDLKQAGIQIDGLGNQAHIHESFLPSPEHVLAVTDLFAELVPRQSITEFDIQTVADEEFAADYTRDLMIACFSHPAYTSFLLWGFWEGSHWEPTAASWNKDWSIKKRGEVLEEWLGKRWRTEVELTTDAAGTIKWRGFPGWYDLTSSAGDPVRFQVTLKKPSTMASIR